MGAPDVFQVLIETGFSLSVVGESLRVEPRARLTDELRSLIRANKDSLVARLAKKPFTRQVIFCGDCAHHIPQPSVIRLNGVPRESPNGCRQGKTSPDAWPPIYPFTGWLCTGWADALTNLGVPR